MVVLNGESKWGIGMACLDPRPFCPGSGGGLRGGESMGGMSSGLGPRRGRAKTGNQGVGQGEGRAMRGEVKGRRSGEVEN